LSEARVELFIARAQAGDDLLDETELVALVKYAEIRLPTQALCIATKNPQHKAWNVEAVTSLALPGSTMPAIRPSFHAPPVRKRHGTILAGSHPGRSARRYAR
jgi:hypothetical protein